MQNLNVLLEIAVKCSVISVSSASDALSLLPLTTYLKQCDIVLIKHVGMNLELDCKFKKKQKHAELCNMHYTIIL